jgi:hypothetical protein
LDDEERPDAASREPTGRAGQSPDPADTHPPPPIEESGGDTALLVVRRALEGIPVAGPIVGEAFSRLVLTPLERRREDWILWVTGRLLELELEGDTDLSQLQEDPAFVTLMAQATQSAIRTHHEEKLEALGNAISNAACGKGPDEAIAELFVQFIDFFGPWHLRLLAYWSAPSTAFEAGHPVHTTPVRTAVEPLLMAHRELQGQQGIVTRLCADLRDRGLIDDLPLEVSRKNPALRPRTTALGESFLAFVRDDAVVGATEPSAGPIDTVAAKNSRVGLRLSTEHGRI